MGCAAWGGHPIRAFFVLCVTGTESEIVHVNHPLTALSITDISRGVRGDFAGGTMISAPMYDSQDVYKRQFVFCVISTVTAGWMLIPLAWMVPMTVCAWGIYKGCLLYTSFL